MLRRQRCTLRRSGADRNVSILKDAAPFSGHLTGISFTQFIFWGVIAYSVTAEIVRPGEIPRLGIRKKRSSSHSISRPFACRPLSSFAVGCAWGIGATHLLRLRRSRATSVRITIPNTMTTPSSTNPATNKVLSVSSFIGW
jgi:hypothetical protein